MSAAVSAAVVVVVAVITSVVASVVTLGMLDIAANTQQIKSESPRLHRLNLPSNRLLKEIFS